jgi:acetyl-CoA acyltransferase
VASQAKAEAAYQAGKIQADLVSVSASGANGWTVVDADDTRRPGTNMEGLADLKTPFRPHGRVTAGNSSGLTDGATACILASDAAIATYGLTPKMHLVSYAFAGVEPEVMGIGPIPSTEKALSKAGLTMDDIGLIEINEAFAVQVLSFTDHFGLPDDDPRVNPLGGAIAFGHPLASSGVRLMIQLAREFADHHEVRYGMTTMCVGLGQGGTVIWENPNWKKKLMTD